MGKALAKPPHSKLILLELLFEEEAEEEDEYHQREARILLAYQ